MRSYPIGGCAIDEYNDPLPEATLAACQKADAILLGAVGGPKWDDPSARVRPEAGLLNLRKRLSLYGNLRPVRPHPDLMSASPIKAERLAGVDLLVVRELTSGIYFGEPRLRRQLNGETQAIDTMSYTESEIRRVAHLAFRLAGDRKGLLTSVDKANVLECSRLWRTVVAQVAPEYPNVKLENLLVDAAAMHLLTRPATFDVLLTANLFGDILTDEASVLSGSMGNLPSASLGDELNAQGKPRGLYEPIHGSAPDIAGKGIANPVGTLMSAAMLLRHSLGLESEAQAIEDAVERALSAGARTPDLGGVHSTAQVTESIIGFLTAEPVYP
jgi:3-isopropylmalate dehydrogenase